MAIYESHEYPIAMEVNLVDYLKYNGYELRRQGNNYAVITYDSSGEHDSLKVSLDGKKWNWFSHSKGGESPIHLVSILDGIDKPYAIRKLADYAKGYAAAAAPRERVSPDIKEKEELKHFELPEKHSDNKRAFAYLSGRGLDSEIINHCIQKGLIYESKKYHNVVFVGQKNEEGEVEHASLRGTYTSAQKPFKGDVTGSNKDYSFALEGTAKDICVYESAVDALSGATIEKMKGKEWSEKHRVTLGGMSDRPLELYLQKHPEIKNITFYLDNDIDGKDEKGNPRNHGQIRADNLMKKYEERGYQANKVIPENKDVNEDLKKLKNITGEETKTKDKIEKITSKKVDIDIDDNNILKELKEGVASVFTSEKYLSYLAVISKFHSYSVNNCILISRQFPKATRVAGYQKWKKEFERQVRKGERGIDILAPTEYKTTTMVEEIDSKTGEKIQKPVDIVKKYFKQVKVFDISQTEGKELPTLTTELDFTVENSKAFLNAIKKTAEKNKIQFTFENISGSAKGYFSALKNIIAVKENMSDAQKIKTAVHELAHSRLHIPSNQSSDRQMRSIQEVEAESIAFVVAKHFGIDTSDYSFPYIASWSSGKDVSELKNSLNVIQKESTSIIQDIEKEMGIDKEVELFKTEELKPKITKKNKEKEQVQKQSQKSSASIKREYEKLENESLIPIKNYEHSLTVLAQKIPLYIKTMEGYTRIKSENEIIKTTETTYLKTKDLERNKSLIPQIFNAYLVRLFNQAFQKNPPEAMKIFNIDLLLENNLLKAFLCNDAVTKKEIAKTENINDCIEVISKRLEKVKNMSGKAIVHITESQSKDLKDGEVFSFHEANKKYEALENKFKEGKKGKEFDRTKFVLYVQGKDKWIMGELRYDIGDGYAKNLMDFIEKNIGGKVAETCKKEIEKNEKQAEKTAKREEQIK